MKKTKQIIQLTLLTILFAAGTSQAQMSDYKFNQQFNIAFEQLLEGEYQTAGHVLEKLHEADQQHGQVAFLLGMCDVKTGSISQNTKKALEIACSKYDFYHQRGLAQERTAPAKAWFYLAKVHAQLGEDRGAINAYRNYMSCVPMASLSHKRKIVLAIKELKQSTTQEGVSSVFATLKP